MLYLWIKSIHVIAVISWMAGLLYLPRLFVYHSVEAKGGSSSELLKIMVRRLLKFIMNPAMIVVWFSGLWLAYSAGYWKDFWFAGKVFLVVVLSGFHGFLSAEQRRFENDGDRKAQKFYRVANEVPTLIMIFVVCLVIFKPF